MSAEPNIVTIKPRDYKLSATRMDSIACEWEGHRAELAVAGDEWHYEFAVKAHADGFKQGIRAYAI